MKKATYISMRGGKPFTVEYDENAPCIVCGLPVVEASMGGTVVCPWCDSGMDRDGKKWSFRKALELMGPDSKAAMMKETLEHLKPVN